MSKRHGNDNEYDPFDDIDPDVVLYEDPPSLYFMRRGGMFVLFDHAEPLTTLDYEPDDDT